jgi:hypothetical protein
MFGKDLEQFLEMQEQLKLLNQRVGYLEIANRELRFWRSKVFGFVVLCNVSTLVVSVAIFAAILVGV